MKKENPTEDNKKFIFHQCRLNAILRRKQQKSSVFRSYRQNNSMSSLPELCFTSNIIFYLIKGILTLHQPFYQCGKDLSSLFRESSWQHICQVCKPWCQQQSLFRSLLPLMETPECLMQKPIQQCTCNLYTQQQVQLLTFVHIPSNAFFVSFNFTVSSLSVARLCSALTPCMYRK